MLAWFRQIERSTSVPQVVAVVRDYLSMCSPEELACLPDACRPASVRDESDIERMRDLLVEQYRRDAAEGAGALAIQRMTSLVVRASMRIAEMREGDGEPPHDEPASPHPRRGLESQEP